MRKSEPNPSLAIFVTSPHHHLLDHVDIIIGRSRRSGRNGCSCRSWCCLRLCDSGVGLLLSSLSCGGLSTPVVVHLLIQLLLCLAGTTICRATASSLVASAVVPAIPASATASSSSSSTTTTTRRALARSGDIAVDSIGSGFGDITATATVAGTVRALFTTGTQATRVALGALYAVEECVAIGGSFTATRDKRETDGLALGIGAVEFADRLMSIGQAFICDVGDALRASSAVIDEGKGGNGADPSEEVLDCPLILCSWMIRDAVATLTSRSLSVMS